MNCLLVMKIKWSLDINTGAVEQSEAARARRLAVATVVGDDVIASTGYMKKQPLSLHLLYLFFFTAAFLLFVHFLKCFSVLFQYILFGYYILCIK